MPEHAIRANADAGEQVGQCQAERRDRRLAHLRLGQPSGLVAGWAGGRVQRRHRACPGLRAGDRVQLIEAPPEDGEQLVEVAQDADPLSALARIGEGDRPRRDGRVPRRVAHSRGQARPGQSGVREQGGGEAEPLPQLRLVGGNYGQQVFLALSAGQFGGHRGWRQQRVSRHGGGHRRGVSAQQRAGRCGDQQQLGRPGLGRHPDHVSNRRLHATGRAIDGHARSRGGATYRRRWARLGLLQHHVDVRTAKTEAADAGATRSVRAVPGRPGGGNRESRSVQVEARVGSEWRRLRRYHAVCQHADGLDQAGHPGRCHGVADVRLDRGQPAPGVAGFALEHRPQRGELGAVTDRRPGAVRLEEAHARRVDGGVGVRPAQRQRLTSSVRGHRALRPAVVARARAFDHGVHLVAGCPGVGQALEQDGAHALAEDESVGGLVEGPAAAGR